MVQEKKLVMLGNGGHAKVLHEALRSQGQEICAVSLAEKEEEMISFGVKVINDQELLQEYSPSEVDLVNGLGALPGRDERWKIANLMRDHGYRFATIVHSSAIVPEDVQLSEGVQVMAGVVLQPGVIIGVDSIVNTGALLDHDCNIGDRCHIAPGATLSGAVAVYDDVHVGTGATLVQNVGIGKNSVIAAGAVVYRSVDSDVVFFSGGKVVNRY